MTTENKQMEPQAKRRKELSECWDVFPVLSDELSRDTGLLAAYAAPILNKRETSRLMKELSQVYPLSHLQHLKRVRGCRDGSPHPLEVIVCLARDVTVTDSDAVTLSDLLGFSSFDTTGLGKPFPVEIPASPPLTRPQFEKASKHWPTTFHEDKHVTSALKGQLFTPDRKAKMQEFMTAAIQAAHSGREMGLDAVGAVMVDPESERIVAVAHDCKSDSHPLHHAVMVCVDLVARGQGGGAHSYKNYPACHISSCGNSGKPVEGEESALPYICTGYELFVTREPCVMCAMALVHSRIRRVFYGVSTADGALGSKYKIHCQKDLNHHFEVFRGVMQHACAALETF